MTVMPEEIALVQQLLPNEAVSEYNWDDEKITQVMTDYNWSTTQAVRFFWLERVNESVEYFDIPGKPISTIHKQARAMLDYWDGVLKVSGKTAVGPSERKSISFGKIERPCGSVAIAGNDN